LRNLPVIISVHGNCLQVFALPGEHFNCNYASTTSARTVLQGVFVLAAGRFVWHVAPVAEPLQWTLIIPAGVGPRNSCQIKKIA